MFEIAGGILLAVFVLVLLPWIIIAALWCAAALAVIAAVTAGIMVPEIGVIELILAVIIGIYLYFESKPYAETRKAMQVGSPQRAALPSTDEEWAQAREEGARRNAEFNALVAKHGIDKVLKDRQQVLREQFDRKHPPVGTGNHAVSRRHRPWSRRARGC